mmetsp:Transcript_82976/g.216238  ORF Transcript_82976/g.216238 Transcript_82976/m.216238 type:complete len:319 (+) Transcript_82976:1426-2382(+)
MSSNCAARSLSEALESSRAMSSIERIPCQAWTRVSSFKPLMSWSFMSWFNRRRTKSSSACADNPLRPTMAAESSAVSSVSTLTSDRNSSIFLLAQSLTPLTATSRPAKKTAKFKCMCGLHRVRASAETPAMTPEAMRVIWVKKARPNWSKTMHNTATTPVAKPLASKERKAGMQGSRAARQPKPLKRFSRRHAGSPRCTASRAWVIAWPCLARSVRMAPKSAKVAIAIPIKDSPASPVTMPPTRIAIKGKYLATGNHQGSRLFSGRGSLSTPCRTILDAEIFSTLTSRFPFWPWGPCQCFVSSDIARRWDTPSRSTTM